MSFSELVKQTNVTLGEMLINGRIPLELVLRGLNVGPGRMLKFPIWCQFMGPPASARAEDEGIVFLGMRVERVTMQNEVEFDMFEVADGLDINLEHRAALFDAETMSAHGRRISVVLASVLATPAITIDALVERLRALVCDGDFRLRP